MDRSALKGIAIALSAVAALIFVGVALTELSYVSDHPYRYGPAKVIAWSAAAGALVSIAVCVLAIASTRADR